MRRNFAQILKDAKIDIKTEYQKLYGMLYDRSIQVSNTKRISTYDELSDYFIGFYFRGTCLSSKRQTIRYPINERRFFSGAVFYIHQAALLPMAEDNPVWQSIYFLPHRRARAVP